MSRTILVPVDFGPASIAAVSQAREVADGSGSQLHLLYVMPTNHLIAPSMQLCGSELGLLGSADTLMALHRLASLIVRPGLDPLKTTGVVRTGSFESAVAQYAAEIGANETVMATSNGGPLQPAAPPDRAARWSR